MKIAAAALAGLILLLALGAVLTWIASLAIEARYPPLGRFVPVGGGRLHVIEAGQKTKLRSKRSCSCTGPRAAPPSLF